MPDRERPTIAATETVPDRSSIIWSGSTRVAMALTFDFFGGEATTGGPTSPDTQQYARTTLDYGVQRGIWRLLEGLEEANVTATFNVCGITAEQFPTVIKAIVEHGHEVAGLGYTYTPPWQMSQPQEEESIDRTLAAIAQVIGSAPVGWRTPESRISHQTIPLLIERGLAWDSSLRNDEIPYFLECDGDRIVEIPYGGSADDAKHFWFPNPATAAPDVLKIWRDELTTLTTESNSALLTLSMRPCFWGRPAELDGLQQLIAFARDREVVFLKCEEVSAILRNGQPATTTI